MRKIVPLLLAGLLATTAHADDKHHPPVAAKPAPAPAAAVQDQRFNAAYDHMKKMMAQMDKIKATKDPAERQRLMQEHMDSLHAGMQAMRPAGGGMMQMMNCQMMQNGAGQCPMMGQQHQHGRQGPGARMDMMEKRMDMMQMMMEQMVEHEGQKAAPKQE